MAIGNSLIHWMRLNIDGNDSISGAVGTSNSVVFGSGYATFTASTSSYIFWPLNTLVVGTSDFTMAGWVYPTAFGSGHEGAILHKGLTSTSSPAYTGQGLKFYNGSSYASVGGGGSVTDATVANPSLNAWHYIVLTRSGTSIKQYIDGVLVASATSGSTYDTDIGTNIYLTAGAIRTATTWFGGLAGRLSDLAVWNRELSLAEISQIHTAGSGKLGKLLGVDAKVSGSWMSAVHSVPAVDAKVSGSWMSAVHSVPSVDAKVSGSWLSVVHTVPTPAAIVPDIVGTPGVVATFDGSASVGVTYYHWSWVTVPGGSAIANAAIPFPDNGAATPIDMTNNEGLWHFEGNANDTSGNARNGTVTGASLVAGKVGAQAYQFGVADNVNFGAASNFVSANFSISLWLKGDAAWTPATWDAIAGASNLFTWSEGFGIFWQNATTIRFFVGSYTGNYVDLTVTPANWNHIVFTWDGSTITGYLNGNAVDTDAHSAALTGLGNDFFVSYLGNHGSGEQTIDEVAIWSRAISASEITDIYAAQNGLLAGFGSSSFAFTPDLVGTYTVKLAISATVDTTADCVVTSPSSSGVTFQGGNFQGSIHSSFQGDNF
jgi:hypothetical protein